MGRAFPMLYRSDGFFLTWTGNMQETHTPELDLTRNSDG